MFATNKCDQFVLLWMLFLFGGIFSVLGQFYRSVNPFSLMFALFETINKVKRRKKKRKNVLWPRFKILHSNNIPIVVLLLLLLSFILYLLLYIIICYIYCFCSYFCCATMFSWIVVVVVFNKTAARQIVYDIRTEWNAHDSNIPQFVYTGKCYDLLFRRNLFHFGWNPCRCRFNVFCFNILWE